MKKRKGRSIRKNQRAKIYGQELIMDLYDCDPGAVRSGKKILDFSRKVCRVIKMKRFGKPVLKRFALQLDYAAGYSLAQLIETSLISGHFSELWNTAYINIFSCKKFDANKAALFTKRFFGAKKIKQRTIIR